MADPREAAATRLRERNLKSGRERKSRGERASGGVDSEANAQAADAFEEERRLWKEKKAAQTASERGVGGDGNYDVEDQIIQKGRTLQEESAESLQNSIRMAKAATETGAETLNKLTAQREQMSKMDNDLDATNASLNRSERVIKGMKSFFGRIGNSLFSGPKHESQTLDASNITVDGTTSSSSSASTLPPSKKTEKLQKYENDKRAEEQAKKDAERDRVLADSNVSGKVKDALREFDANKLKEDEQLDELGGLLNQLKGQAQDVNHELKVQEKLVEHLDNQIGKTSHRLNNATTNTKKI